MNAHLRQAIAESADFRIVTKIFGGILGPEYTVAAGGRYYRVGQLTLDQLKRGIPAADLDLLEVDPETDEAL
ncbi:MULTISPECIES: hypothetical protein [Mesorhizobium]|uniref:Uncharacterized protein n=2 Tax=Mesorhizobium TaxID=68287 RepID=A0A1A5J4Q0_RHILI|nr:MULTISPECIES: hypothetical protein [Mesorhizobium]ETA72305.1 hypothetical protein MesloDRAFT_1173 [Mesorhizobium japonicum R7A]MBE1709637.1 hypothetical protein [Mesorhizobium japonicum]MBE1714306.1 hypothetical protein [Mesorhizobium japonicum]MUT25287.1 hypothetical protein [Mesorhizobium japonicum]MUT28659.1 hypothetical protein [Mesorhizobium japonicum]